jgi:pyroglutamyl-peptidase
MAGAVNVLLTGFRPYGGEPLNASEELVRMLARKPARLPPAVTLKLAVLPVTRRQFGKSLATLLRKHEPDYVLLFGQAPGRNRICLERIAHNNFRGQAIRRRGPALRRATLPRQAQTIGALRQAGIPAARSRDAGDYFCNMALYLALEFADESGAPLRAGLVHVPVLPRQAGHHGPAVPGLPLATLRRAARIILANVAAAGRRQPYSK